MDLGADAKRPGVLRFAGSDRLYYVHNYLAFCMEICNVVCRSSRQNVTYELYVPQTRDAEGTVTIHNPGVKECRNSDDQSWKADDAMEGI